MRAALSFAGGQPDRAGPDIGGLRFLLAIPCHAIGRRPTRRLTKPDALATLRTMNETSNNTPDNPRQPQRVPHPWERAYPPGVEWAAPIARTTLTALLAETVARFGPHPALRFRAGRLSFAAFGQRVDAMAAGLMALGLRPGERVALLMANSLSHPLCFFAALRAGLVVVHLSPLDPPRALAAKLADVEASLLIAADLPELRGRAERLLRDGAVKRLLLSREAAWDDPDSSADALGLPLGDTGTAFPEAAPDDLALLQFTGGTTGHPRAAMLSHGNLAAAVSIYGNWNRPQGHHIRPGDRVLCALPLFHIFALTSVMLRALLSGGEVMLMARFDPVAVLDAIEACRATVFAGVPTMWIALARTPGVETRDLSSLRMLLSGGAPLPVDVADRIEALTGQRVGGGWGMTETSPCGTNLVPGTRPTPGLIGVPLPGICLRVVDSADPSVEMAPGKVGEIAVAGPNVTRGYWRRPEETARAFHDGFLLTGDLGFMQPDGNFVLVDRKKDMILCGGFNVYPRIIEEAICEHPDVLEAAVIGVDDDYRGQSPKAFVVLRPGAAELSLEALRAFLADRLGRAELPTALERRDALPKTQVGKLSRHELRAAPPQ